MTAANGGPQVRGPGEQPGGTGRTMIRLVKRLAPEFGHFA